VSDWADPTMDDGSSAARVPDADGVLPDHGAPATPGVAPVPSPGARFGLDAERNPAQQAVLDLFDARAQDAQQFDAALRHELKAELEHGLAPLLDAIGPDETLFFSKYPLGQVHGCEVKFLADRSAEFAWTVPSARGSVAHKAIELSIHWKGEPAPLFLVDEAIARLQQGSGSLAEFLQTASEADLAELRAEANERVFKFLECFPPLKPQWRPVTESAVRVELFDRRIVLQGRVDLTLGHARGTTARKVLIDFKSGGFSPIHVDDLRFYALLEAVRIGTPPRQLATYYLDTGRPHPEIVTQGLLEAAIERTIDGATRMVELEHAGREPLTRTGPACRWCPVLAECAPGRAWIEQTDDIELVAGDGL
jgi:hypothetical protein